MNNLQKWGGVAALFEGAAYIGGMLYFILIADYSTITGPIEKVAYFIDNQTTIYMMNIFIYVLFGAFMVILSIALYERLKSESPALVKTATAFGLIWAAIVIASGMVSNIGMEKVIGIYANDPALAGTVWLAIEAVADGIGGGNEIVGGVWILLISIAALKVKKLPKALNYTGLVVGIAGILSTVPPLGEIAGMIFGLVQIIWFIWLGIILLRRQE